MQRKKWEAATEITSQLLISREKRKWQVNLRRYVIEQSRCPAYAPYFGLDISNMRLWFQNQFENGIGWDNFGKKWQFDHIIPVSYFNQDDEQNLKLCWNFINIRVQQTETNSKLDILGAKRYFEDIHTKTNYPIAKLMVEKIRNFEELSIIPTDVQTNFILEKSELLNETESFSAFEFELLNHGRTIEEVKKEVALVKSNLNL